MIIRFKLFESIYKDDEDKLLSLCYYSSSRRNIENLLSDNPKININVRDNRGWTPLLIAVNNNNFYIARLLIKKGADPDIFSFPPPPGQFPWNNDTVLFKMIDNVVHNFENEPSSMQSKFCDIILDELLKIADLNKQTDNLKYTPLIKIAMNTGSRQSSTTKSVTHFGGTSSENGLKLLRKFIEAGADVTIKDKDNKDFLDYLDKSLVQILSDEYPQVEEYVDSKKYNL